MNSFLVPSMRSRSSKHCLYAPTGDRALPHATDSTGAIPVHCGSGRRAAKGGTVWCHAPACALARVSHAHVIWCGYNSSGRMRVAGEVAEPAHARVLRGWPNGGGACPCIRALLALVAAHHARVCGSHAWTDLHPLSTERGNDRTDAPPHPRSRTPAWPGGRGYGP